MIKKLIATLLLAATAFVCVSPLTAQDADKKKQKMTSGPRQRLSPHETISTYAGGDRRTGSLVTITYGRPYSQKGGKGEVRKIWGGLVPWGKADRLGADEATTIITQHPLEFDGTTIPAGAHTLYIIPSEDGSAKLAFSKNIGKWGIPVDETKDIGRVNLKKEALPEQSDQLTLGLESTPTGGVIKIMWEKTQYSAAFTVKK